jgi:cytochrome P450
MSRVFRAVDRLAQEHTERAVTVLAEILDDPFAENKDRIRAAESLLDRGHGKPAQAIIALPMNREQARRLAAMSDDDLLQVVQAHELPRLNPPTDLPSNLVSSPTETPASLEDDPLLG